MSGRPPVPPVPCWDEDECLDYYGLLSLHRMFEVVGAQLTDNDVAVLSFLLAEAQGPPGGGRGPGPGWEPARPPARSGLQLLLELERRGQCDEGNLGPLLQLLRLLTRHDLLPHLTLKRPRPVSPERYSCGPSVSPSERRVGSCLGSTTTDPQQGQWETGSSSGKRQRVSRGRPSSGPRRRGRGAARRQEQLPPPQPPPSSPPPPPAPAPPLNKVTCDIRLRVRAEYCEHARALQQGVQSRRPQPLARQLDLFSQATAVLKSRDLGSVVCDIKFSELSYLDAFWGDYLSGALLRALRGVFLTEALRDAVGREPIRLLVSVDEGDYEAGRRLLLLEEPGGTSS
ncbi:DNA-binding death effector domain-containing protein 2 [Tachyglossus aculeatus]|uniref:DNA-binding death effector domain-containing protein 2 n=1 Tax=Tachyglossus aculeatus TaxID=9261 RepID=UPI0018F412AE|nr:DNA-binding death effector domain-containing protein 2 [Tachyglossus aculeatus]XP_038623130.1 DNA-binding death effector domain-containing protein 2 [Tachyglossus aculeatus]XP_038623131.1 DNA-binding death effector domain-containing protein 2 [Tachyglossus aculeatus]